MVVRRFNRFFFYLSLIGLFGVVFFRGVCVCVCEFLRNDIYIFIIAKITDAFCGRGVCVQFVHIDLERSFFFLFAQNPHELRCEIDKQNRCEGNEKSKRNEAK